MTLTEYYDALNRFDWYYDFSDDGSVWRAGESRKAELLRIAADGGQKFTDLWKGFVAHHFSGGPWGNEKEPKPVRPNNE